MPLALLTAALVSGCGSSGTDAPRSPAGATTARTTPASGTELCVRVVTHWSREVLEGGTYGDYQSMGLSNRQYDILREVVDAARPVRREQGARAAEELTDRLTRARCAERYAGGGPTGGPW
ncbi:hypothetical protein GTW67_17580 [Streptomyces sp. SID5910]|nr:hypothetical protein [Streptomyces sp. SID5910]